MVTQQPTHDDSQHGLAADSRTARGRSLISASM
jgi:hypothetical protein